MLQPTCSKLIPEKKSPAGCLHPPGASLYGPPDGAHMLCLALHSLADAVQAPTGRPMWDLAGLMAWIWPGSLVSMPQRHDHERQASYLISAESPHTHVKVVVVKGTVANTHTVPY